MQPIPQGSSLPRSLLTTDRNDAERSFTSRLDAPSAYGFLPRNIGNHSGALPSSWVLDRPASSQRTSSQRTSSQRTTWSRNSDRSPPRPLRVQSAKSARKAMARLQEQPIAALDVSHSSQTHLTHYHYNSRRSAFMGLPNLGHPQTRHQLDKVDRRENLKATANTKANKVQASGEELTLSRPSARPRIRGGLPSPRHRTATSDTTTTTHHIYRSMEGLTQMAHSPPPTGTGKRDIKPNMTYGDTSAPTSSPYFTYSSRKHTSITPAVDDGSQHISSTSSRYTRRNPNQILGEFNSNIGPRKNVHVSLPGKRYPPESSVTGQATGNPSDASRLHPAHSSPKILQRETNADPESSHIVHHDNITLNPPEPEPLTPHHRPLSQQQLIENIVTQSQETSASLKVGDTTNKQCIYSNAGTQYETTTSFSNAPRAEPHTPSATDHTRLKSDNRAITDVVQDAWHMMSSRLDSTSRVNELMAIMDEVDEMAKARLPPEKAADIDWTNIWAVRMMLNDVGGPLTPETLEKMLH